MIMSTTVVEARAYSLASGETSEEIEIGTSPSTSSGELPQPLLVPPVDVRVHQADRDALDAAALQDLELCARLALVERR